MADYDTHTAPVQRHEGVRDINEGAGITAVHRTLDRTPVDRARWGPILAGLFTAISVMALLSTLGLAIGLSSYDPSDSGRAFAIGGGIWAVASALIAFFVGGLVAGRSSALPGRGVGLLNGAMVWAVGIPVLLYLVTSLAGSAVNTAGSVAATAANTAANALPAATDAANSSATPNVTGQDVQNAKDKAKSAVDTAKQKLDSVSAADVRQGAANAAEASKSSVWYTLLGMVLALAAAAVGGAVGARDEDDVNRRVAT